MNVLSKYLLVSLVAMVAFVGCKDNNESRPRQEDNLTIKDSLHKTIDTGKAVNVPHNEESIFPDIDISPMDMSYFPSTYPQLKMANPKLKPPVMRVIYSRPHLQGRKLFEGIIKYGQIWRLGANEATELDVFQPVIVGDKKIPAGRYTLYAIPKAGYWTIAINTDLDLWGLKPDVAQDVVRVQIPVAYYNPIMEYFAMVFEKTNTGANLIMAWDDVVAKLPIKI